MRYTVTVRRSFTCDVEVEADSAQAAVAQVERADFPLPALDQWSGMKDWDYTVYNADGSEADDEQTWTFMGHWEGSRIVIDYVVPGTATDDRIDTGRWPEGLWCDSGTGATVEEAEADAKEQYETAEAADQH